MRSISPGARRILLPAAAAVAFTAFGAGIAHADDEVPPPAPPTASVDAPTAATDLDDQVPDAPAPAPLGDQVTVPAATDVDPVAFEQPASAALPAPGPDVVGVAHGDSAGELPGPAPDEDKGLPETVQPTALSRPVVLVPAEVGSTELPDVPVPGPVMLDVAATATDVAPEGETVADPIPGDVPSRPLLMTPPGIASVPAVYSTLIDKSAIVYTTHQGSRVGDDDITAGLTAAGVNPDLTDAFSIATRTIIGGESGGNDNAVNRRDANARGLVLLDGAPAGSSRGLMQTVPGTFAVFHAANTSNSIYDPVANIAAAWRYINARYKVNLETGAGLDGFMARGIGHGVGY